MAKQHSDGVRFRCDRGRRLPDVDRGVELGAAGDSCSVDAATVGHGCAMLYIDFLGGAFAQTIVVRRGGGDASHTTAEQQRCHAYI